MASAPSIDFVAGARAHYERRERIATFGHPLDVDRPSPVLRAPELPDDAVDVRCTWPPQVEALGQDVGRR